MKKTLLTLALVAASVAAFAQGKIQFGNDSNHYFVIGVALAGDAGGGIADTAGNTASGAVGAIPISPLPSGKTLLAALYAGANLTLQTSIPLLGTDWLQAGRMANKNILLTGVAGGTAQNFQIVVADIIGQTPARDAAAAYYGTSGVFTAIPGTSLAYPTMLPGGPSASTWAPANLVINAIPEPASFALAGLGAALLIFRRRK